MVNSGEGGTPEVALGAMRRGQPSHRQWWRLERCSAPRGSMNVAALLFVNPMRLPSAVNTPQLQHYAFFSLVLAGKKNNTYNNQRIIKDACQ